jgi:hypothetical protein
VWEAAFNVWEKGGGLCENIFLETETKYPVVNSAFAAILNRPRHLQDSITARKDTASAFHTARVAD